MLVPVCLASLGLISLESAPRDAADAAGAIVRRSLPSLAVVRLPYAERSSIAARAESAVGDGHDLDTRATGQAAADLRGHVAAHGDRYVVKARSVQRADVRSDEQAAEQRHRDEAGGAASPGHARRISGSRRRRTGSAAGIAGTRG